MYEGIVTTFYDSAWWVAYVTGTDPEMQEVTLSFLNPHGPGRLYYFPRR